jgi:acyl-CoA synthetase (AMP-forming)/AMP-acid ligase II
VHLLSQRPVRFACMQCPYGTPGELLMPISMKPEVTGMQTFNGYKDDPDATARKIARDVSGAQGGLPLMRARITFLSPCVALFASAQVCAKGDAYFRTGDLLKQVRRESRCRTTARVGLSSFPDKREE